MASSQDHFRIKSNFTNHILQSEGPNAKKLRERFDQNPAFEKPKGKERLDVGVSSFNHTII